MIKSVIFDLDGTLLNRDVSVQKFVERQYERLHKWVGHIPIEIYISRFIELDCRGYVWKDKVYKQLVDAFDIQGVSWTNLLDDYVEQFKYSCIAFPNLIQMFDELKHEKLTLGIIYKRFWYVSNG
ncbi:HAD hydrolase-like protein [Pseudogracilibacillus auburnensis]|uniref:Haloacid dehalogenase-like hydrolase n=1 Tax=Pseudogracilibacillus auburnensis TaxID=1494959 RepID=A0A2V3VSX2_9BACI|nr:haloacid dehalogenase-like hydrolase [Pseudogracilibacillus auburnensis]